MTNLKMIKVKFLKAYSPFKKGEEGEVALGLTVTHPQHFEILESDEVDQEVFDKTIKENEVLKEQTGELTKENEVLKKENADIIEVTKKQMDELHEENKALKAEKAKGEEKTPEATKEAKEVQNKAILGNKNTK